MYYRALGFQKDYTWASHDDIPFSPPKIPLSQATVALVTTAVVDASIPKPVREANSYPIVDVPDHFDTSELSWDKETTHTKDRESYFPINDLRARELRQEFKALAPRFHFVPTEYSQRHTIETDAPLITRHCLEDAVDLAILIPL